MTRTEQLLAAYPDARTKFPGWWESETRVRSEERGDHSHGSTSGYWVDVQYLELRCIAPDLTKPENLHHLMALADAVDPELADYAMWKRGEESRTDAVLNALEKALEVGG